MSVVCAQGSDAHGFKASSKHFMAHSVLLNKVKDAINNYYKVRSIVKNSKRTLG